MKKRWFASGRDVEGEITIGGETVPFGMDLLFQADDVDGLIFHVEICEDVWAPAPPSDFAALAGALILTNLSASNIVVGKSRHAAKTLRNCSPAAVGRPTSTPRPGMENRRPTWPWDGQACIYELGAQLAETERFSLGSQMAVADIDVERLQLERMRTGTFNEAAIANGMPDRRFRRVTFHLDPPVHNLGLQRRIDRFPFVPNDPSRLDQDCYEAFNIQLSGLAKRLEATGTAKICIGVSGGLDSAHALIVAAKVFDLAWTSAHGHSRDHNARLRHEREDQV